MNAITLASSTLFTIVVSTSFLLAADSITVSDGRPLSVITTELQTRYGYLVSYEEAPFDSTTMITDVRSNSVQFRHPPSIPIVFHVPDLPAGDAVPTFPTPGGNHTAAQNLLLSLVKEYNDSGNPGQFAVLFDGGYAHIVPAARMVDGKALDFEPILSTLMSYTFEGHSCSDALNDLFNRVSSQRGVTVVRGRVPVGPLLKHECDITVNGLAARSILEQILGQIGTSLNHGGPRALYSWLLMYDVSTDKYYLSTAIVPSVGGQGSGPPDPSPQGLSQSQPATPATPPAGKSRAEAVVPVPK